MNTYLVKLLVGYKNGANKQITQWVVGGNNQIQAQAQALYKENHTYSRSEIDAICRDSEYTSLNEGDFCYKVAAVIELQEVKLIEIPTKTVLVPKDTKRMDTIDGICPVSGDMVFCHVCVDWHIDGKRKELKMLTGGRNQWAAIAHALDGICGTMTHEEIDSVINKRAVWDGGAKGSFALRGGADESCLYSVSMADKSEYLIRLSESESATNNVSLATWDAGM